MYVPLLEDQLMYVQIIYLRMTAHLIREMTMAREVRSKLTIGLKRRTGQACISYTAIEPTLF